MTTTIVATAVHNRRVAKASHWVSGIGRLAVVAGAVLVVLLAGAAAAHAGDWSAHEGDFVAKANAERAQQGLAPLALNTELIAEARAWSDVMAREDRLYHNPDLANIPGDWTRVGENVGVSYRPDVPLGDLVARLHQALMDSPGHRANILGDYNQIGVGVRVTDAGKLWVTQVFMLGPLPAATSAPPATAPATAEAPPAPPQVDEAIRMASEVFAARGADGRQARFAVLSRADVFADSLAGAALAGDLGPILFTPGPSTADPNPGLHPGVAALLRELLGDSGRVYVLGGPGAISDRTAADLAAAGFEVRRLAGPSRVETSVVIAGEVVSVRGGNGEVLIARADTWPDAVTGGAYAAAAGVPVVLTGRDSVHPAVARFLEQTQPQRRWALGGAAALSDEVVTRTGATRLSGGDRTATAVEIAERLWNRRAGTAGDSYVVLPSHHDAAWAYALAYAPYSAASNSPQLLVGDPVAGSVHSYLSGLGYSASSPAAARRVPGLTPAVMQQVELLLGGS